MARLLSWPNGLRPRNVEPLSGPRTVGVGGSSSISGYAQSVSAPFGLIRAKFTFPPMKGQLARRVRGWITALHGGANATRVPWFDRERMTLVESGLDAPTQQYWSNDQEWSNSEQWQPSYPFVAVSAAGAKGATEIVLADEFWGSDLGIGDEVGFLPFHLAVYGITEVIEPGRYRVWPPLRGALTTDDLATLEPTIAMRLESADAASLLRDVDMQRGVAVTLVEVPDDIVRSHFAD